MTFFYQVDTRLNVIDTIRGRQGRVAVILKSLNVEFDEVAIKKIQVLLK